MTEGKEFLVFPEVFKEEVCAGIDHKHAAKNQFADLNLYILDAYGYDDASWCNVDGKCFDFVPVEVFANEYNAVAASEYEGFVRLHRFLCFFR